MTTLTRPGERNTALLKVCLRFVGIEWSPPTLSRCRRSTSMKGTNHEHRDVQLAGASTGRAYAAGDRPGPRAQQQPGHARRAPDARERRPLPLSRRAAEPPRAAPRPMPRPRPPCGGRGRLHSGSPALAVTRAVSVRARRDRLRPHAAVLGASPRECNRASLLGGGPFRFVSFPVVENHMHHVGTSTASGPSAARRTPGVISTYPLAGCRR